MTENLGGSVRMGGKQPENCLPPPAAPGQHLLGTNLKTSALLGATEQHVRYNSMTALRHTAFETLPQRQAHPLQVQQEG